jgi:hypothetical protein
MNPNPDWKDKLQAHRQLVRECQRHLKQLASARDTIDQAWTVIAETRKILRKANYS